MCVCVCVCVSVCVSNKILFKQHLISRLELQNTHTPTVSLQRGKTPNTSVLVMTLFKIFDGEAPVMLEL